MMKKLLASTCLFLLAQPALAEPWTVGSQTITYTNAHPFGSPNTAPAYSSEPADVASNFTELTWTHTTGQANGPAGGQYDGPGVGQEAKARFDCNAAFESQDDPIIAPGVQNGSLHKHTFFGNLGAQSAPYNATYSSLRASGNSTCYGGPLNRTLYWEPSVFKLLPSGVVATIKPKNIITYYVGGVQANQGDGTVDDPSTRTRWPRDISMIFGFDMNDPTNTRITNAIAAGDAANGGPRYQVSSPANGFIGWTCVTPNTGATAGGHYANSPVAGALQPYLRNADGTATLDCLPGTDLQMQLQSYPCWDGVNLHSPNGRGHFIQYIRDSNTGKNVCPDNWYRTMVFVVFVTFNQSGSADYKEWYFSSDRMPGMTQYLNGQTAHADLIPAWSYGTAASPGTFLNFTVHCAGITVVISGTTLTGDRHECGSGRIDSTEQTWAAEASPDGSSPNPLVVLSPNQTGSLRYFPLTAGTVVPGPVHHKH
jgi:hypothetical protein